MPVIFQLISDLIENLMPGGDISPLPFLIVMYLSLGSTLYTLFRMLRRANYVEAILSLSIPFVLFGTLFILEPLVTQSLFGSPDALERAGIVALIATPGRLYAEAVLLSCLLFLLAWLFTRAAKSRVAAYQSRSGWLIAAANCGLELAMSAGLAVAGISTLLRGTPPSVLNGNFASCIFVYSLIAVTVKAGTLVFILLYTLLFGARKERVRSGGGPTEGRRALRRVERLARRRPGYIACMLGLMLLLYAALFYVRGVHTLGFISLIMLYLLACWLLQAVRFLFPYQTTLRKFSAWGDEEHIAELFCAEYLDAPPVKKTPQYTLTRHFLVDEGKLGMKIHYLPWLERQSGATLFFSDNSRCRLRQEIAAMDLEGHVKAHTLGGHRSGL